MSCDILLWRPCLRCHMASAAALVWYLFSVGFCDVHSRCISQDVGLYSAFAPSHVASLWHLWSLAITGQPLMVFGSDAHTCSLAVTGFVRYNAVVCAFSATQQCGRTSCLRTCWMVSAHFAVVCFVSQISFHTSLIAPIKFSGDFRPFFTIYDPDFREVWRHVCFM